jgi:hypothetical protein
MTRRLLLSYLSLTLLVLLGLEVPLGVTMPVESSSGSWTGSNPTR